MKERVFSHTGSLLGGVIHNLNTPLMWIMGRAQLIEARNETLEDLKTLPMEEIEEIKKKNNKDIASIIEGAEKINDILKALTYKTQMADEGFTVIDLREYLKMETDFLMADMRFKHQTKTEIIIDETKSSYIRTDYNVLSSAITGIINTIINSTENGRTLKILLESGIIKIICPDITMDPEIKKEMDVVCKRLYDTADIYIDDTNGIDMSIKIKEA
ncbi:MAG: hypothetical protein U9P49_11860 [Thermodesulfobacteriota bacterium]|nr:hypothetical protein [Thermodesulfobacteriota bacterium]